MPNASANRLMPFLLLLVLFLTGCSANRQMLSETSIDEVSSDALLSLPSFKSGERYLSGSVKMTATVNGEKAKAKGKLRIKRDGGIQIGATAMGLMEAACFEFLPDSVRFLYKIDKICAGAPYSGVPFLDRTGTDYRILESVLLNKVFLPGGGDLKKSVGKLEVKDEGECIVVYTPSENYVIYRFYIEKSSGRLVRSEGYYGAAGKVVCRYSDFAPLSGRFFPCKVDVTFESPGESASLLLELSKTSSKEFKFAPRRVSKAYRRVSFENLLNSVGSAEKETQ